MNQSSNQVLALAAILQSAYLVDEIARNGEASAEYVNPLIQSLFAFDADSTEAIYGGVHALKPGLELVIELLGGRKQASHPVTIRYAMAILHLHRRVSKEADMFQIIHNRLQHTAKKSEHFSSNINEITKSIAAIYQDTISTLKYRLHVKGNAEHLQVSRNADMIRSLLLSGIRAAVLWQQVGGSRWHFLLSRKRLIKAAQQLLQA